jgi:orotidine-5'-phosphate decarboxylase
MERLISLDRSVIPACDVNSMGKLMQLVLATSTVSGIGAYKIGLELVIPYGLKELVQMIRDISALPIIYDHQKGGTDIPELGAKFARAVKSAGVDAVILFPFGGAKTEREWIKACQGEGLVVLVGGHMTQAEFLESEKGFISNKAPEQIYGLAADWNVRNFVVPGNKVEFVDYYRLLFENMVGEGNFTLYAPGFVDQGGEVSKTGKVAGKNWHAIVGGGIYNAGGVEQMKEAAVKLTSQIR